MNIPARALRLVWLFSLTGIAAHAQSALAPAAAAQQPVVQLEEYKVTDQQDAYKGNTAITGTKTDVPLIDVPAPINVITREVIDDLAATDITDLYTLMGSVTEFSYGGTSMRGFRMAAPDPTRYNGIAGSPYNDFGISTLHNVEQIEILKGPVGLLYGDNEPGGMINIVTAKPKAKFGGSVGLKAGSYDLLAGSVMVTGPIDAQKRFLYLFNTSYTERGSFRNNYEQKMLNLTGSLTWVISPATRLNLEVEDITNEQPGARIRGVPFLTLTPAGTLAPPNTPGGRFMGPISFAATEPTDFQNLYTTVYNARFDHARGQPARRAGVSPAAARVSPTVAPERGDFLGGQRHRRLRGAPHPAQDSRRRRILEGQPRVHDADGAPGADSDD
jgi:outer membrane receptor protein involved in Fe transport